MRYLKNSVRGIAIPTYRLYAWLRGGGTPPRVIINSVPKAGTHLAKAAVEQLPRMVFSGLHLDGGRLGLASDDQPTPELPERFAHAVRHVHDGQFITAHLPFQEALAARMSALGFRMIFVIRDPRDVVVSHAKYVAGLRRHFLHDHYRELADDDRRLLTSIVGVPPAPSRRGLLDIGSRLARYTPWTEWEHTLTCRFEDLIGPSGGGTRQRQEELIRALARHLNRNVDEAESRAIADRVWSPSADTFRKGAIGDWRNHFRPEHLDAFEKAAGAQARQLGY